MRHKRGWYVPGLGILALILIAGCGMPEFKSLWRDRTISIDGRDGGAEWENARFYFEKYKVTVGLMNDGDMMYVRLSTRDRLLQRQLLTLGFTLWFDETGNKERKLGIHFPLGLRNVDRSVLGAMGRGVQRSDSSQVNAVLEVVQNELELIGPKNDERRKFSIIEAQRYGILCRIDDIQGNMVYELQFPLHRTGDNPFGIISKDTRSLGIGFETGKMAASTIQKRPPEAGGMGGGRGGMGGGMGGDMSGDMSGRRGGMGGGRGAGRSGMSGPPAMKPLELWIKVGIMEGPEAAVSAGGGDGAKR